MYTIRASSLNRTTLRRPKRADRRSRASVSFAFAVSSSSRSRCASRCASCSCACAPMGTVRSAAHARATSRLRTIPRAQWWACVRACVRACTGVPRRPRGGSGGTCSVLSCVRCSSSRSAICGGKKRDVATRKQPRPFLRLCVLPVRCGDTHQRTTCHSAQQTPLSQTGAKAPARCGARRRSPTTFRRLGPNCLPPLALWETLQQR